MEDLWITHRNELLPFKAKTLDVVTIFNRLLIGSFQRRCPSQSIPSGSSLNTDTELKSGLPGQSGSLTGWPYWVQMEVWFWFISKLVRSAFWTCIFPPILKIFSHLCLSKEIVQPIHIINFSSPLSSSQLPTVATVLDQDDTWSKRVDQICSSRGLELGPRDWAN